MQKIFKTIDHPYPKLRTIFLEPNVDIVKENVVQPLKVNNKQTSINEYDCIEIYADGSCSPNPVIFCLLFYFHYFHRVLTVFTLPGKRRTCFCYKLEERK
jgi:hypothetical protein